MNSDNPKRRSISLTASPIFYRQLTQRLITRWAAVVILIAAILLRLAWAALQMQRGYTHAAGEAYNVALAIANGRGIADAYYVGQGATAHVTPFTPAIAGGIYAVFGEPSFVAEATLCMWGVGVAVCGYCLWYKAFAYLDVPQIVRLLGLGILAMAPMYITLEAVDFRVWDGALVSLTSSGLFLSLVRADRVGSAKTLERCMIASLLAILLFLNPNLGLAAGLATCLLMLRRYDTRQAISLIIISGLVLLAIVLPWVVRNQRAFEAFVPLRSNAGLELAIANYEGAASGKNPAALYKDRLAAVHPYTSIQAASNMKKAGGEVRYSSLLGDEAKVWIGAHPKEFVQIYASHVQQFFFPQQWQFSLFGGGKIQSIIRSYLGLLLSIGAFFSLIEGYRRRDIIWLYPALFLIVPALIYGVFQPVPRYTYLVYGISALMSADGYYRFARRLKWIQ